MFTVKFIDIYGNNDSCQQSISTPNYKVYTYPDGSKEVTIFKDYLSVEGVTYWVGDREGVYHCYDVCYVENINGKTIDTIRKG